MKTILLCSRHFFVIYFCSTATKVYLELIRLVFFLVERVVFNRAYVNYRKIDKPLKLITLLLDTI